MSFTIKKMPLEPPDADCDFDELGSGYAMPYLSQSWRRAPKLAGALRTALNGFDRAFDWAYGSNYNPLYKSGTVAMGLLLLVVISGIYLFLFYRIGLPYESTLRIENQVFAGRWIRALHRYASDLCVWAVGFHLLRMAVEGKTWGPRALAWVSGVILLGVLLVCGWTGFVMVWDLQGQRLAEAGARMMDVLHLSPDPISRSFSGTSQPLASFFFMNLFLHVAAPLGMLLGLWLHTARLARSSWLPKRKLILWMALALSLFGAFWPARLLGPAELQSLDGRLGLDLFFNGWLPLETSWGPQGALIFWILGFVGLASMPWWWRPNKSERPLASYNDPSRCEGCRTCVEDCPFEAIAMVPHPGGLAIEVAQVDESLCVSCGLCVGSCDRLSIAPPDRDARAMLRDLVELKKRHASQGIVLLHCRSHSLGAELATHIEARGAHCVSYAVACLGSIHSAALISLLGHFKAVVVLGCPPSLCQTREGYDLFIRRVYEGRQPTPPGRLDSSRILTLSQTSSERSAALAELGSFLSILGLGGETSPVKARWQGVRALLMTSVLLSLAALLSAWRSGETDASTRLRVSLRMPGQLIRNCRDYSHEELEHMLKHMRRKQKCVNQAASYRLTIKIDGEIWDERVVAPRGARADRPLVAYFEKVVPAQSKILSIDFRPEPAHAELLSRKGDFALDLRPGRAALLILDEKGQLELKP